MGVVKKNKISCNVGKKGINLRRTKIQKEKGGKSLRVQRCGNESHKKEQTFYTQGAGVVSVRSSLLELKGQMERI